jgi:hypothetical protein
MDDLIKTLVNAPTNSVLVLAGLAFLAVAVFGRITARLDPGPKGRIGSGVLGAVLLAMGLVLPTESHRNQPTAGGSEPSASPSASAPSTSAPSTSAGATSKATAGAPVQPAPVQPPSSGNVASASPASGYPIALAAGQVIKREDRTYTILKIQLDENDAREFALEVTARMLNEGRFPANFWNANFRLVVDGVPQAPVGSLNEVVEANAAKDGVVKFAVPKDAKAVELQVDRFGSSAPGLAIALPQK